MTQPTETEAQWIARKYYEALTGSATAWNNLTEATKTKYINAVQILIDGQLIRAAYEKLGFDQSLVDAQAENRIQEQADYLAREAIMASDIDNDSKAEVIRQLDNN